MIDAKKVKPKHLVAVQNLVDSAIDLIDDDLFNSDIEQILNKSRSLKSDIEYFLSEQGYDVTDIDEEFVRKMS